MTRNGTEWLISRHLVHRVYEGEGEAGGTVEVWRVRAHLAAGEGSGEESLWELVRDPVVGMVPVRAEPG
ncbi:hypothetical protein J0910_30340 [Nocardiopsis sp. CNT-189]|uniref:hypothetical protein n=1 Tax=Nocardiopsis oceanisediminis TaxID=2816862 RepID=UPI003B346920